MIEMAVENINRAVFWEEKQIWGEESRGPFHRFEIPEGHSGKDTEYRIGYITLQF